MTRDTLITVLLVLAGIVLALVLFGAGAFWKGRTSPKRSSQISFAGCKGFHLDARQEAVAEFRDQGTAAHVSQ